MAATILTYWAFSLAVGVCVGKILRGPKVPQREGVGALDCTFTVTEDYQMGATERLEIKRHKLNLAFAECIDRIEAEAGKPTPQSIINIAERAVAGLESFGLDPLRCKPRGQTQ